MYLKELSIKYFKSFYGEHKFCFDKGINVISGGSGSGKTNLCRAVEFALFGAIDFTPQEYVNVVNERLKEADSDRWFGCEVDLLFKDSGGCYRYKRDYSPFLDHYIRENAMYPTLSPKITSQGYHDIVYVDDCLPAHPRDRGESLSQLAYEHLAYIIDRNFESGLGFLILDDSLSRLSSEYREKVLKLLGESGLEQVILLMGSSQEAPRSYAKFFSLGKTIETITFKVEDFPFSPKGLHHDIDGMIYNRYVTEGEVFTRQVYEHDYTIEAVEVNPNGARYRRETSRIIIL